MEEGFRIWANPSSPHAEGRRARAALEDARQRIKAALGWDGEVIFTSGASEAAQLAFDNADVIDEVASAVEHDAIYNFVEHRGVGVVPVGSDGALDMRELDMAVVQGIVAGDLVENRALVAVQHINSETGNRQDIGMVAEVAHGHGALLLVDCSQSAGKFEIPQLADMAIISAHKFGGPIGVGALLVKHYGMLAPTGGHERGYRRGTENLPGVLGMAAALEACTHPYVDPAVLAPVARLADTVRAAGGCWLADRLSDPTPYIHALAMPNISGSAQLMRFDMAGFAVSQGSACSSGTMKRSHVLEAMELEEGLADRMIRLSVGWNTTAAELDAFVEAWRSLT